MNSTIERRPFKVLTPARHSTAMVIARYSGKIQAAVAGASQPSRDLIWKALRLGALSAACAFSFLVVSQRNLVKRSDLPAEQSSSTQRVHFTPSVATAVDYSTDAKSLKTSFPETTADAPVVTLPQDKNLKVTEFSLVVSPEFQDLGPVQVKLSAVNAANHSYDITVKTNGREFYRQDVPINESVSILKRARHSPQIVVAAVEQNRVFGYLAEPVRGSGNSRRRRHS